MTETEKRIILDILHYGEYLTDIDIQAKNGDWYRIRNIAYEGKVWYLTMKNGIAQELKQIV